MTLLNLLKRIFRFIMYKHKASNKTYKRRYLNKCNECHKWRRTLKEHHQICKVCYKANTIYHPSGNKFVDEFIRYTQTNHYKQFGVMEFVPYDRFKNVEFVVEGGSSKIFKATWKNGFIRY